MKHNKGFSLIELLVVIAIAGILAAIAYPSYTHYVVKSQRSDCMGVLTETAQLLERHYTENLTYVGFSLDGFRCPAQGDQLYEIEFDENVTTNPSQHYFKLIATPVDGTAQGGDGYISIDSTGAKDWKGNGCWQESC